MDNNNEIIESKTKDQETTKSTKEQEPKSAQEEKIEQERYFYLNKLNDIFNKHQSLITLNRRCGVSAIALIKIFFDTKKKENQYSEYSKDVAKLNVGICTEEFKNICSFVKDQTLILKLYSEISLILGALFLIIIIVLLIRNVIFNVNYEECEDVKKCHCIINLNCADQNSSVTYNDPKFNSCNTSPLNELNETYYNMFSKYYTCQQLNISCLENVRLTQEEVDSVRRILNGLNEKDEHKKEKNDQIKEEEKNDQNKEEKDDQKKEEICSNKIHEIL
ncbi:3293_t:CDS:2, partial [Dentiscutata erythropus]